MKLPRANRAALKRLAIQFGVTPRWWWPTFLIRRRVMAVVRGPRGAFAGWVTANDGRPRW